LIIVDQFFVKSRGAGRFR